MTFTIFEDGRPQQVTFFQKSSLPLALALLIDTSASMEQNLAVAQEAAIGFVRELGPADVASVIDFDTRVQVRQGFTSDQAALESAIRKTAAGGSTALYNAVYIALKELNKTIRDEPLARVASPRHRHSVRWRRYVEPRGFDEVLDLAARSDTAIYAIGLLGHETPGIRRPNEAPFVLRRFAEQTGGRAFFPPTRRNWPASTANQERSSRVSISWPTSRMPRPRRSIPAHCGSGRTSRCRGSSAARLLRTKQVRTEQGLMNKLFGVAVALLVGFVVGAAAQSAFTMRGTVMDANTIVEHVHRKCGRSPAKVSSSRVRQICH